MKHILFVSFTLLLAINSKLQAELLATKLKDRIQTQIRPKSFNHWHHQETPSSLTIKKMQARSDRAILKRKFW